MLRARIFLNLIPRFAILIGVSALAQFLFSRMAGNVGRPWWTIIKPTLRR